MTPTLPLLSFNPKNSFSYGDTEVRAGVKEHLPGLQEVRNQMAIDRSTARLQKEPYHKGKPNG